MDTFKSDISNLEFPLAEKISGKTIRKSILDIIQSENPGFTAENLISLSELNKYRKKYLEQFLNSHISDPTELDNTVLDSLKDNSILSDKIDDEDTMIMTIGQRVADRVATFGGSWTFIISFGLFLLIWISVNIFWLANRGFDPYPFILLNLILSSLAAIQAPVIMMSQNRQEEKDRDRSKKDYMINLKSELEIRMLHEKIDHLMIQNQQAIIELHKVQIDMINDVITQLEINRTDKD